MTFTRTRDFALVGEIMTHRALYDAAADDFATPREYFTPREDEAIFYVLVHDGDELLGLFALAPQNQICWEVHTRLLPHSWGKRALTAARELIAWVWASTPCRRLVTSVPLYNRLAWRFAERAGMAQYGLNLYSWQKNGVLVDQVLLGVSKSGLA